MTQVARSGVALFPWPLSSTTRRLREPTSSGCDESVIVPLIDARLPTTSTQSTSTVTVRPSLLNAIWPLSPDERCRALKWIDAGAPSEMNWNWPLAKAPSFCASNGVTHTNRKTPTRARRRTDFIARLHSLNCYGVELAAKVGLHERNVNA